jgi:integrase
MRCSAAQLLVDLLSGCGLRVSEPLELRVKDVLWVYGDAFTDEPAQIARGRPVHPNRAVAIAFGHHDHRRIFVDIQAHVFIRRLHMLVPVAGCFGCCSLFTHSPAALPLTG